MKSLIISAVLAIGMVAGAEELTWSRDGSTLTVTVPAGFATGQGIRMFYDRYEKGGNLAKWTGSTDVTASVPAEGGTYELDLTALNVPTDSYVRFCRVKAADVDYELLTRVKQDSTDDTIDTGVKDTDCYGLKIGVGPSKINGSYPALFGSGPTNGSTTKGLQLQFGGSLAGIYFSQNISGTYTYKWTAPAQNSCNDYTFQNNVFTFNGSRLNPEAGKSYWSSSPVGHSGDTFYMGCLPSATPTCNAFAWWYYLTFYGSDGQPLADYLPARRLGDNVLGLYDQVSGNFVTPINSTAVLTTDSDVTGRVNQAWITKTCQLDPPLAATPAEVSEENGVLKVVVHPKYAAGSTLYLAYGLSEKGDNLNDWPNKYVICSSVPAAGGEWNVTLADVGVTSVMAYRVFAGGRFSILDRVKQDSSDDLVDTGIRDVDCIGLNVGVWIEKTTYAYAVVFGSAGSNNGRGIQLQLGGNTGVAHFGQDLTDIFSNGNYTYYTSYPQANQCNDYWFMNNTLKVRGGTASPGTGAKRWWTTPIARSEKHFCLGGFEGGNVSAYSWWYYVKLYGWDGQLLVDYVPVKRSDGTAGFFDHVTAVFIKPATGSLAAGNVTAEEAYVGVPFSETHLGVKPVTATWIGGTSPDLEDPENWDCRDANNAQILGALPQRSLTSATFTGALAFNVSPTTTLWREGIFPNCTLAATCDWRGMAVPPKGTISLNGNGLYLNALDGTGTFTDNAQPGGELVVDVPQGQSQTYSGSMKLTGSMKLVKIGAGTLSGSSDGAAKNQTFTGGTEVLGGTVNASGWGTDHRWGAAGSTIEVGTNGVFELQGMPYFQEYTFVLNGGTLKNSTRPSSGWAWEMNEIKSVRVDSNSTIDFTKRYNIMNYANSKYGETTIDLKGNILTVYFREDMCYFSNVKATRGTMVLNGTIQFYGGPFNGPETTFDLYGYMTPEVDVHIGTYICRTTSGSSNRDKDVYVYECFKPFTDMFWGCILKNGATLDLSMREEAWNLKGTFHTGNKKTVKFEDNATIYIDLGERQLKPGDWVVVWDADQRPSNLANLRFRSIAGQKGAFEKTETGLRYSVGMTIFVR